MQALWVEASGDGAALMEAGGLDAACRMARQLGLTDLLVQVFREGQAWYPSNIVGTAPHERTLKLGFDPLPLAIDCAKRHCLRLHAWFNVFNLAQHKSAKILASNGVGVLLSDNRQISLLEYPDTGIHPQQPIYEMDAPRLWLDPSHPLVQEYVQSVIAEFVKLYPNIRGIHLDYFRFPYFLPIRPSSRIRVGMDFGYGAATLKRFSGAKDTDALFENIDGALYPRTDEISLAWDRWRREQISQYLPNIRKILSAQQKLSVAVLAWPERAFFCAFQNWRAWAMQGLVDCICPMAYTADTEHFAQLAAQSKSFATSQCQVAMGIGAYLLPTAAELEQQIHVARSHGLGVALFSYRNLKRLTKSCGLATEDISSGRN